MRRITTYCHLDGMQLSVNGKILTTRDAGSNDSWFKQIYREQEFLYPKFHKMDVLSQTGFITTELIKRSNPHLTGTYLDDEVALCFANSLSSSDTDQRFRKSYQENGTPSPALFVYTLPNIVLGEIAILNKWYGENMFAVLPKFAPDFFLNYTDVLMTSGSKAVLCGWLGIEGDKMNVFVFLVEESDGKEKEFSAENLIACAGFA